MGGLPEMAFRRAKNEPAGPAYRVPLTADRQRAVTKAMAPDLRNNPIMKRMRNDPDMLEEYDFSKGVRGKHAKRYAAGTNVVVLDPDVAEYFPDHKAVNDSLRSLIAIVRRQSSTEPAAAHRHATARP